MDDNSKDLRKKYSEENSQKSEDDDCDVGSGVGSSSQVAAARLEVAPDMQLSFVKMLMKRMKRGSYYLQVTCMVYEVVLTTISTILE